MDNIQTDTVETPEVAEEVSATEEATEETVAE